MTTSVARLSVRPTPLAGVMLVQRQPIGDARGSLTRLFCAAELAALGWHRPVAQINHTQTGQRGTVRGLHYQRAPHAEMKLVTCLRGAVWDVAVDLRPGSPSYLRWHAERLSPGNACALLIPEGCAHGLQTLLDDTELLYCHSAAYTPDHDAGIDPMDRQLDIRWPLPVTQLSKRDADHPSVAEALGGARQ